MDEMLQLKKKEYVEQKKLESQETGEFFYMQPDFLQQQYEKEAEDTVTEDYIKKQKEEAKAQAGLDKTYTPEQQIPAETVKEIDAYYEKVKGGKKLSGKDRKRVMREYKKKKKTQERAKKALKAYDDYRQNVGDLLGNTVKNIENDTSLKGNERKNIAMVTWATVFTGQTMIGAVEDLRSLSINVRDKETTQQQRDRWALVNEKIFNVVLNFDLKKLAYKNTDEFMKNISERMAIGNLCAELDYTIRDYRELAKNGKINEPMPTELLNEIEARINLIMEIHNTTKAKLEIMQSDYYTMLDQDTVEKLSDDKLKELCDELVWIESDQEKYSEEERKQAHEKSAYYKAILSRRMIKNNNNNFGRGMDPEKMLETRRKDVEKKNPSGDIEGDGELEKYSKETRTAYREKASSVFSNRAGDVTGSRYKVPNGQNYDAIDYAKGARAEYWAILRDNKELRRREIQKYYGKMHRGRMIPPEVLSRIEERFMERYNNALSLNTNAMQEENRENDELVETFCSKYRDSETKKPLTVKVKEKVKDKEGKEVVKEVEKAIYTPDRSTNATLRIHKDKSMEEQLKCYNAFYDLYHLEAKDYAAPEEAKKAEQNKELIKANKDVIDYFSKFDLNKLCFSKTGDLMANQKEITAYVQFVGDVQYLPRQLYIAGAISDDEFLNLQARVDMVMDFNGVFQNIIAADSTMLRALTDDEDLDAFEKALPYVKGLPDLMEKRRKGNPPTEMDMDRGAYDNLDPENIYSEFSQFYNTYTFAMGMLKTAKFKPGEKPEDFMPRYREMAVGTLNKVKEDIQKKAKE